MRPFDVSLEFTFSKTNGARHFKVSAGWMNDPEQGEELIRIIGLGAGMLNSGQDDEQAEQEG